MRSPGGSTGGWLGAPASVGGGLPLALTRGLAVGCSVVQIFLKNQRQWTARPYTDSEVREFRAAWKSSGIRVVFAHASYLINLATPVAAEWHRAVDVFQDELERAEALGLPFVLIHPGSHQPAARPGPAPPREDRAGPPGRRGVPPAHDRSPLRAGPDGARDAEGPGAAGGPGRARPAARAETASPDRPALAGAAHALARAARADRASGAVGRDRQAHRLPQGHQQILVAAPIAPRGAAAGAQPRPP